MTIASETTVFIIFLLNGVMVGILFDFFRILRKSFKTPDFVTYIEDICFGIVSGTLLIFSILIFNNGELRLFIFVAILLGILIYMLTISEYVIKVNVKILKFISNIFAMIFKVIFFPIRILCNKLINSFKLLYKKQKIKKNKGFYVKK